MKRDMPEQTYEWHFLTRQPANFLATPLAIRLFGKWVEESARAHADFEAKLRQTALTATTEEDPTIIRQALQCLAHVGTIQDSEILTTLQAHDDPLVSRDARTCIVEIQQRAAGHTTS